MLARVAVGCVVLLGLGSCARDNPAFGLGPDSGSTVGDDDGDDADDGERDDDDGEGQDGPTSGSGGMSGDGPGTGGPPGGSGSSTSAGSRPGSDSSTGPADSGGQTVPPPTILYVNFEGPLLTQGPDDATADQSMVADLVPQPLLPYGDDGEQIDILLELEEIWAPFHVEVVGERPSQGTYAMVAVTATEPPFMNQLGQASLDCGNRNPSSVGMVFAPETPIGAATLAVAIAHSAGQGYGLENVVGGDVMSNVVVPESTFVDECIDLLGKRPQCAHIGCPLGTQNSYEHLSTFFPIP